jgi:hypothetical protein
MEADLPGHDPAFIPQNMLPPSRERFAPWHDHARPRSFHIRTDDRPGHVSVPGYMTAFAAVKTRCRAPSNGVSIHELASTAPVSRSLRDSRRICVRYSARPGRNSASPLPSPEDWPFSRTPRMETCVVSPYRSPVPPRPDASGCSRYGTGGIVPQKGENEKDYFPISFRRLFDGKEGKAPKPLPTRGRGQPVAPPPPPWSVLTRRSVAWGTAGAAS